MPKYKRIITIVMDSLGIGPMADSEQFGDAGADTLGHIAARMETLQIPNLVGGAIITETVFAWPGLGQLVVQSIGAHDMSVVQACVVIITLITMAANLLADVVYCLIDPRIRY